MPIHFKKLVYGWGKALFMIFFESLYLVILSFGRAPVAKKGIAHS